MKQKHWTGIVLTTMVSGLMTLPISAIAADKKPKTPAATPAPAATPPAPAPDTTTPATPADAAKAAAESIKNGNDAIRKATIALEKEYTDFEKDPTKSVEKDSTYFKRNQSADVTQLMILRALDGNYGDNATDAYVKWQLLSAVAGKFDDSLARQALQVYQRAAAGQLVRHPGSNHQTLDQATARLGKAAEAQETQINDQLDAAIKQNTIQNMPMIEYRNLLYSLIPASPDLFMAGMQDAVERTSFGISGDTIMKLVIGGISEWTSDAKPQQLRAMADALKKMSALGKQLDASAPYVKMTVKSSVVSWSKGTLLTSTTINTEVDALEKDIAHPPEQLGFKKEE